MTSENIKQLSADLLDDPRALALIEMGRRALSAQGRKTFVPKSVSS
jgi:hypothetical protein